MAGRIPQTFIDDLLARVDIVDVIDGDGGWFHADAGHVSLPANCGWPGRRGRMLLPRGALSPAPRGGGDITGRVVRCRFRGDTYAIRVRLGGCAGPEVEFHTNTAAAVDTTVPLAIDARQCRFFPDDTAAPEGNAAAEAGQVPRAAAAGA
jgi:hypothetical protein